MDKILFYVRSFEEAKKIFPHVKRLYSMGWEVAFATDDWRVAELLAYAKVLVVKPGSYQASVVVSDYQVKEDGAISFDSFQGALA